jgi:polysaccharide biosynthesis protein PslG
LVRALALTLAVAVLAGAATAAPTAEAAGRTAPFGFAGVMWDGDVTFASAEVQDSQWALMARSGVESVRTVFNWAQAQPTKEGPIDFSATDSLVRRAAERRIELLPVVLYAPEWARAYRRRPGSPPQLAAYTQYLRALILRYGPAGSFWTENPTLARRPLRAWQIWNEPHLVDYWTVPRRSRYAYPKAYGALLRASYRVIKREDPGAKVVLAGITQRAWDLLAALYRRARIHGYFDAAALHAYPETVGRLVRATRLMRSVMRKRRDGRKQIYITEVAWPASKGRTRGVGFQRQETSRGMARKVTSAFKTLARQRRRLRLTRIYWYTWASSYGRRGSIFKYSGLVRYGHGVFARQPALRAFQRAAGRLQGCAKDSFGACNG